MKIIVCIKQVPAKDAPLSIAGNWIKEADIGFEMNEPDSYALEEALRLKEKHGGEVSGAFDGPGAREANYQGSAGEGRRPRNSHQLTISLRNWIRWARRGCWPRRCEKKMPT